MSIESANSPSLRGMLPETWTIVFLDGETIPSEVTIRTPSFPHQWISFDRTSRDEVVERSRDADVVVVNKVKMTAELLAKLPKLRMIAVTATGTDNVDMAYCRDHGIAVANVRGYASSSVPEHAFAMILALRRSLLAFNRDIRDGRWQNSPQFCFFSGPILDLAGAKLGIVGRGSLGTAVARIADAFRMEVMFAGRKGVERPPSGFTPWSQVLATCDVLTLHCPLTSETRGLIGLPEFRAMARRPILINTARGGVVDEHALITAMDEGLIAGAGFDVSTEEPPRLGHPLLSLVDRPNFILTPHVAWASLQAMQVLVDEVINNIERFVASAT